MVSIYLFIGFVSLLLEKGVAKSFGGKGYDYGHGINRQVYKRDIAQSRIVQGVPPVDGQPQLRLEIRNLQKNTDLWNLYILGLSWMQYTSQDDPFSWYQLAGIHGAPGLTWGDVAPLPGTEDIGYCHHVSVLFPTWHRPYLVLYEQTLYDIIQYIASLWPAEDLARFQNAAKHFRIPYWDWAIAPPEGESVLPPSIANSSVIEISGPKGLQWIANPLFRYSFKNFNESIFPSSPYNQWNETKRAPYPATDANALSNNSLVAASFDDHLPTHQQRLYNLLANYPNYTRFSNEGWIEAGNNGSYDSIESLHDSVHTIGGGGWGHLAIIAYSAFDPLFQLHHANIDRIFAIWQAIHNDSYVEPSAAVWASHTQYQGDMEDVNSPLKPFYVNETSFWTSEMIRSHEQFGYTYASVVNKTREQVIADVNRLYTDYSPATMIFRNGQSSSVDISQQFGGLRQSDRRVQEHPQKSRAVAWHQSVQGQLPLDVICKLDLNGNRFYREWIANLEVQKHVFNRSYSIYLLLEDISRNSTSLQKHHGLVGSFGVFAGHSRPMEPDRGKVTGTIPLTSALIQSIVDRQVSSLEQEDVEPFLKSALQVKVVMANGTTVGTDEVDGLRVSIVSSAVLLPPTEGELPKWGEFESIFDLVA